MNRRIEEIPPSLIRSINARKRLGDIDLGLGEPSLPPDMVAFEAALEWTRASGSPYSPNAGFPELRRAIADYLGGLGWVEGRPQEEHVCVTVGSEEALFLAIKTVVDPSVDEVLIVEPCYLAYPKICLLEGIRHRLVSLASGEGFRPRADTVLQEVRPDTRLIILNTPCNPTGRVWPEEELRTLAEGLRSKGGAETYVLADEVYRELYYGESPPASIASFHPATLIAGSLSKSNALTGLRLGWLAGPRNAIAAATTVHQFVNTSASTFSQRVALALVSEPERLTVHRGVYARTRRRLLEAAQRHELELLPPEGAFYALIRLPESMRGDSLAAAERLLDAKRLVSVPGRAFGASGEGWLRITWVGTPDIVEEGVRRIAEWFAETG